MIFGFEMVPYSWIIYFLTSDVIDFLPTILMVILQFAN